MHVFNRNNGDEQTFRQNTNNYILSLLMCAHHCLASRCAAGSRLLFYILFHFALSLSHSLSLLTNSDHKSREGGFVCSFFLFFIRHFPSVASILGADYSWCVVVYVSILCGFCLPAKIQWRDAGVNNRNFGKNILFFSFSFFQLLALVRVSFAKNGKKAKREGERKKNVAFRIRE